MVQCNRKGMTIFQFEEGMMPGVDRRAVNGAAVKVRGGLMNQQGQERVIPAFDSGE